MTHHLHGMFKNKRFTPFSILLQTATLPVDGVTVTVSDIQMRKNKNSEMLILFRKTLL